MAERVRDFGMDRALHGKIAAKYDSGVEQQIHDWILSVTGIDVGSGKMNFEKNLKNGQTLCQFIQKLYEGTSNLPEKAQKYRSKIKFNTMSTPFKQMENIEVFLNAVEAYGVERTSCFAVVDLYEGRNMSNVLACFLQLGTEAQRNGFSGSSIGPRPTEKHIVHFTEEQLKAGQNIIGLQAGTNKCASQSGMRVGSRHIADIKVEEMSKAGEGIIGLQAGSNKFATQAGMHMGRTRHIYDVKVDAMCKEGEAIIGLQAGTNQCASQAGMNMGAARHINDIKVPTEMSADSNTIIGLQSGTNKGASQTGMTMGGQRHINDMKIDAASNEGQAVIGLQMGSNQGASQSGMSMGKARHIVD